MHNYSVHRSRRQYDKNSFLLLEIIMRFLSWHKGPPTLIFIFGSNLAEIFIEVISTVAYLTVKISAQNIKSVVFFCGITVQNEGVGISQISSHYKCYRAPVYSYDLPLQRNRGRISKFIFQFFYRNI